MQCAAVSAQLAAMSVAAQPPGRRPWLPRKLMAAIQGYLPRTATPDPPTIRVRASPQVQEGWGQHGAEGGEKSRRPWQGRQEVKEEEGRSTRGGVAMGAGRCLIPCTHWRREGWAGGGRRRRRGRREGRWGAIWDGESLPTTRDTRVTLTFTVRRNPQGNIRDLSWTLEPATPRCSWPGQGRHRDRCSTV